MIHTVLVIDYSHAYHQLYICYQSNLYLPILHFSSFWSKFRCLKFQLLIRRELQSTLVTGTSTEFMLMLMIAPTLATAHATIWYSEEYHSFIFTLNALCYLSCCIFYFIQIYSFTSSVIFFH